MSSNLFVANGTAMIAGPQIKQPHHKKKPPWPERRCSEKTQGNCNVLTLTEGHSSPLTKGLTVTCPKDIPRLLSRSPISKISQVKPWINRKEKGKLQPRISLLVVSRILR
ncbi:hypothetical protein V6N11_008330 [Hibiscus sabdariffa]